MTQEEFLLRARSAHGEKFDYSQTVYINSITKVEIVCKQCGKTIRQYPESHMKYGCNKCNNADISQEDWVLRARKAHGETVRLYTLI